MERLQISEMSQFEIVFKSLLALEHNLEKKKVLNFYFLYKLKLGDNSRFPELGNKKTLKCI